MPFWCLLQWRVSFLQSCFIVHVSLNSKNRSLNSVRLIHSWADRCGGQVLLKQSKAWTLLKLIKRELLLPQCGLQIGLGEFEILIIYRRTCPKNWRVYNQDCCSGKNQFRAYPNCWVFFYVHNETELMQIGYVNLERSLTTFAASLSTDLEESMKSLAELEWKIEAIWRERNEKWNGLEQSQQLKIQKIDECSVERRVESCLNTREKCCKQLQSERPGQVGNKKARKRFAWVISI